MWTKRGLIINPKDHQRWWMKSHAMLPTIEKLSDNKFSVYFSGRDENNVSHIGRGLITVTDGEIELHHIDQEPVFSTGDRGCFDDNGVTPSCIVEDKLYYIGWNSGTTTYRMSLIMGLCFKNTNGKSNGHCDQFIRNSRAPLMNRTDREPFGICTAPFVVKENIYKMWYVSGESWINKDLPVYNIKYATSDDGITWKNNGVVSLELLEGETALARPCVLKTENGYEMYFSYKNPKYGYRIGYAISVDGITFQRADHNNGLGVSKSGWDSEMVEYSYVFKHLDKTYMLYNGNGYGETGIGYAVKQ